MTWQDIYLESFNDVSNNIKKLNGITLAFNTNVDLIYDFNSALILDLIHKLKISNIDLFKKIVEWKGVIDKPTDFVVGLCGCFEKGKASEWIIRNENTYKHLLKVLPKERIYRIGGQAGIMANVLCEIGVPRVIVHTISLPNELKKLFSKNKNLCIPLYDKKQNLIYKHPKKIKHFKYEELYPHIISEYHKNDILNVGENIKWKCPRDNRFIATFDPLNSKMEILETFLKNIEDIAQKSDALIISGFHMFNIDLLGEKGITDQINSILSLIDKAKQSNPNIIIHYESCSTKNNIILDILVKLIQNGNYIDSLGCNERELAELLDTINEKKIAENLRSSFTFEDLLEGCIKVFEKLSLKRIHLHYYGLYMILIHNEFRYEKELIRKALCFASTFTAFKAYTGKSIKLKEINSFLSQINFKNITSNEFLKFSNDIKEIKKNKKEFLSTGFLKLQNYFLIIIPTVVVDDPVFTVGLGDTISASALAAEIALRKIALEKK